MHSRTTLLLTALTATAILALAITSASARRFQLSEQNWLAAWTPNSPLNFRAAGTTTRCPVTLDGSFHSRTLSKVCGQLIGYINQAIVANANCTGGHATALTETLPWHIQYRSFSGELPNIELIRIQLVGARFQVFPNGLSACLAGTTQTNPAVGNILRETEGAATRLVALPEFVIPLQGGFSCSLAGNGAFEGTASVSSSAAGRSAITVTLVQ
jgi:hypothetical protein